MIWAGLRRRWMLPGRLLPGFNQPGFFKMGQTVIEKIIQKHSDDEVKPGKIVWMGLDIVSARDFGGPNVARLFDEHYGESLVFDRKKVFFTFDLCVPACTLRYADNQQLCREFAQKKGFEVYDVDRGIGSHVLMEEGLARPGAAVVGTDSHMNILGAVNCFGQGMGDVDITFACRTGKTWFEVPETVRIEIKGEPGPAVRAKDLILYLCRVLETKKIALKAAEFFGNYVDNLPLSGRITLCSMITEMAGIIGFVPNWSESVVEEIKAMTGLNNVAPLGEPEASYSEEIKIDISGLPPQVAVPYLPTKVMDVDKLKGTKINSGFLGSCTNGRAEDFRRAAEILKGHKVRSDVMLRAVPATRRVYRNLLEEGILKTLFQSGVIISNPGCGGCAEGHIGLTGRGEIQISTGNRNFLGKQGKGQTYLASPEVVAASCIAGEIISPEDL